MNKTKILIVVLISIMALSILTPTSNAALQSNGATATTQIISDWMMNVRGMESIGGALGLAETINSDLTSSSGSNNLDIHMEKNIEYGAIAILSASSYGNPNKITDGGTTTGNETGIVMKLNEEIVAASVINSEAINFINANNRYKDTYNVNGQTAIYVERSGDALTETKGWHGSTKSDFLQFSRYADITAAVLVRAVGGSIFSYSGNPGTGHYYQGRYPTRAIMICGEGI